MPVNLGGGKVRGTARSRLFLTEASWVKPNRKTARLLQHEQVQFRFGRLCDREIEAEMNSSEFSHENYRVENDAFYLRIIKQFQSMNLQYDSETANYANIDAQKRWDEMLDSLLQH